MGYDDNTPLTGVTGGGLPAEIWHEVMVRVQEGLPPRPLPMILPSELPPPEPTYQGETFTAGDGGQGVQEPVPQRQRPTDENLFEAIGRILSGG